MEPMLLEIPESFETERLFIRTHNAGDGAKINEAIIETFDGLKRWMPWADHIPSVEETEAFVRKSIADFVLRKELNFLIFLKDSDTFAGCIGIPRLEWSIPRFEIGYWMRKNLQGNGYTAEAAKGLTKFAFEFLKAKRVEIRCASDNIKSRSIPPKIGYELDGILRNFNIGLSGEAHDVVVFSKIKKEE